MVDKGVGALPRPLVYSVPVQTPAATIRVGLAVPNCVFGVTTWAERVAMRAADGGSGVVPPLLTVGVPEVEMRDVGSTTSGGVKGRKWGPSITNAYGLVIHGVSCNQGVAALWSQARQLRVGVGKSVVGMRWLISWERRLQRTMSTIVVYFDQLVNIGSGGLVFGGRHHPVEKCEFGQAQREFMLW